MNNSLVIFGTGTLAKLAHYYVTCEMGGRVCAFVVDRNHKDFDEFLGLPVVNWDDLHNRFPSARTAMYVAVGYKSMKQREEVFLKVADSGYDLINISSRSTYFAQNICMGQNNFFMPGVVCEPGVKIGSNNVIWSNVTLCHDVEIGCHNFVASNVTIGGETILGNGNFLGFSSVILQQKRLGDGSLFAANSLITLDAESRWCYRGAPAKKWKSIDPTVGICIS